MKKTTYDPDDKQTVLNLMARGWTNKEIKDTPSLAHIENTTLRTWRKRMNGATKSETFATPKKEKVATPETHTETLETSAEILQREEKREEKASKTDETQGFLAKCVSNFHPADLIYYGCLFIACNAITGALHSIGYAVAVIVAAVSFVALQGVKSETGWRRGGHIALLAFFEVVFFALHWWWANNALWSNVAGLPFDIWANKYRDSTGELVHLYGGSDLDKPFLVAVGVAVIMLVCTIYVVWISIQAAKERTKNTPTNATT